MTKILEFKKRPLKIAMQNRTTGTGSLGEVIDLEEKRLKSMAHFNGEVRCMDCKHQWQAVWPVDAGVCGLECPSCGMSKGVAVGFVHHLKDEHILVCQECSVQCDLFMVLPGYRAVCLNCGHEKDLVELEPSGPLAS